MTYKCQKRENLNVNKKPITQALECAL